MTAIEPLLRQPVAQAIAWALLQFVWQGALIGLITAMALAALKRSAADVRYVIATIALSLMLTMPVVTAVQSWRSSPSPEPAAATSAASTGVVADPAAGMTPADPVATIGPGLDDERRIERAAIVDGAMLSRERIDGILPLLLLVWLAGVSLLTIRLVSGWIWIQHLRTHGAPADEGWQTMAARLGRRLHITRAVQLLESSLVEVPTVIGWIKPVILLPASALAGLAPQQLEAILAHELAHVRRQDYMVNLLQTLVETLLFYHPAVWWLSRRIRLERENCCDDIAVSLCGDPYTYARALADLEERRGTERPFALAATGGGSLLQRVRRLLGAPTSHAGRGPGWLAGTAAVLVMGGIVASALGNGLIGAQQTCPEPCRRASAAPPSAVTPAVPAVAPSVEGTAPAVAAPAATRVVPAPAIASTTTTDVQAPLPAVAVEPFDGRATAAVMPPLVEITPAIATTAPAIAVAPLATTPRTTATVATAPALVQTAVSAVASTTSVVRSAQDESGTFVWSNNGERLEVKYHGQVEFTDDDTDVKRLSPGGSLKIKDGKWSGGRTIEFKADASGTIERRYWVGMSERPFEPEGRQWLAKTLPRFIRQTGIGAEARAARILKSRGASGLLAEIGLIEGSWAKRVYFRELVRQTPLDSDTARQALLQAGREIDSDFELASFLIDAADKLLQDDAARKAYFDASRTIESDFEMRRVYASALKRPVSPAILAGVLDASESIASDFELASLLVQVAKLQPLDQTTRGPFFAALGTVGSDFEHRRVLSRLAARGGLTPEIVTAILESAITLESDFELASLLTDIVKQHGVEGALRAPFFRALDSVESSFEHGRVLQGLARRPDLSAETVLAILKSAQGMSSGFETSQVMLAVASAHPISGPARDVYIDAAEKLGDYEQGRVLTALVKNERRK